VVLGGILTATAPMMWMCLAVAAVAGSLFGVALITVDRQAERPLSLKG
jgi:hypothetical protein